MSKFNRDSIQHSSYNTFPDNSEQKIADIPEMKTSWTPIKITT